MTASVPPTPAEVTQTAAQVAGTPPDPPGSTLLPKFMEQAWAQHQAARQTFVRDLSIATLAVVLLLATFFRSVDLIEEIATLEQQQRSIKATQSETDSQFLLLVRALPNQFREGERAFDAVAHRAVPCAMTEHLLALNTELELLDGNEPGSASAEFRCSDMLEIEAPTNVRDELSHSEWMAIQDDDPNVTSRVINQFVVQPFSRLLRDKKQELLDDPVLRTGQDLVVVIERQRSDLQDSGAGGEITANLTRRVAELRDAFDQLDDVEPSLKELQAADLADITWPLDSETAGLLSSRIMAEIEQQQRAIHAQLQAPTGGDLTDLLADLETHMGIASNARTGVTDSQLTKREAEIAAIRENYAEPLPGAVALEPKDAARFFPLILSLLLGYFALRYLRLEHRAEVLAQAFRSGGLSDSDLRRYMPGLARDAIVDGVPEGWAGRAFLIGIAGIALLPALLAVITATAILGSESMSADSLWLFPVYFCAGLLLVGAYGLLLKEVLRRRRLVRTPEPVEPPAAPPAVSPPGAAAPQPGGSVIQTITGRLRQLRPSAPMVVAAVGFLAALSATLVSFSSAVTQLTGRLEPPMMIQGEVQVEIAAPSVMLGTYLEEHDEAIAPTTSDPKVLTMVGTVLRVTVETVGLTGERLSLRWSLFDAATNRPVPNPEFRERPYGSLIPEATQERTSVDVWIPHPPAAGRYFAEFSLNASVGRLDVSRSPSFDVGGPTHSEAPLRPGVTASPVALDETLTQLRGPTA